MTTTKTFTVRPLREDRTTIRLGTEGVRFASTVHEARRFANCGGPLTPFGAVVFDRTGQEVAWVIR